MGERKRLAYEEAYEREEETRGTAKHSSALAKLAAIEKEEGRYEEAQQHFNEAAKELRHHNAGGYYEAVARTYEGSAHEAVALLQ